MSPRRPGGPRRLSTLDGLPADVVNQARQDLARALRRHDRTPSGLRGEESGSHVPYRLTFDDHGVFLELLTTTADSQRRAWEADRIAQHCPSTGGTPRPAARFGDVVAATWSQVRDWLHAPEQLHLFDAGSVAA